MFESPAKPAPGNEPRQAQQVEARAGPDILHADIHAGADGNLVEAFIGQAVDPCLHAGKKAA